MTESSKLAILLASLISGGMGYLWLRFATLPARFPVDEPPPDT